MKILNEALEKYNVEYVSQPVFMTFCLKKNELINKPLAVCTYTIESFLKLLKSGQGIKKIYIYKNPETQESFWKTSIVTDGQEAMLVVRGLIEAGNNRYSLNKKGREQESERHHYYLENVTIDSTQIIMHNNSNNT